MKILSLIFTKLAVSIQPIQGSKYEKYNRYFSHLLFISGCDSNDFLLGNHKQGTR